MILTLSPRGIREAERCARWWYEHRPAARMLFLERRARQGPVSVGWPSDGRTSVDRDTEIAIELLCDHLSIALERLEGEGEPFGVGRNVVNLRG